MTVLFSIVLILKVAKFKSTFSMPFYLWSILGFWIIYSIRIIYDLVTGVQFGNYPNLHVVGFAFGNILIPILALIVYRSYIDTALMAIFIFKTLLIANLLIIAAFIIQNNGFNVDFFRFRPHIYLTNDWKYGETIAILNPIQIGFYGELLLIVSLFFLWFRKYEINRTILGIGLVLGFFLLVLGASRGPAIGFLISLFVLLFCKFKRAKSITVQFLKISMISTILFFTVTTTIGKKVELKDISVFNRMSQFVDERIQGKEEARSIIYASAWNDFINYPIVGKSFVNKDGWHPHNIFLEVFMATGVVGAFLFFCFFMPLLFLLYTTFTSSSGIEVLFLGVILVPILIGNLFSGNLFQSVDLWIMIVSFLCAESNRKRRFPANAHFSNA